SSGAQPGSAPAPGAATISAPATPAVAATAVIALRTFIVPLPVSIVTPEADDTGTCGRVGARLHRNTPGWDGCGWCDLWGLRTASNDASGCTEEAAREPGGRHRSGRRRGHARLGRSATRTEEPMTMSDRMFDTHPALDAIDGPALAACLQACRKCATACTACADACLAESDVTELISCIRTDLDCAEVCAATAAILTRRTATDPQIVRAQVTATRTIARACAEECEMHAEHHAHCRLCAEACRSCERACTELLAALKFAEQAGLGKGIVHQ